MVAADQRRELAGLALPLARDAEDLDRRRLALELELADRLEVEPPLDLLRGRRADRDAASPCGALQARRGVDRVAERVEPLLRRRVVVGQQHDRPGVDADASCELHAVRLVDVLRVGAERGLHRERRAHRAFGVVVVRARDAEERVEPVARELRDGSAEALDLGDQQARHLVEEELRPLRPESLADRRRVRDVREENRHDATLALRPGHAGIIQRSLASPDAPHLDRGLARRRRDLWGGRRALRRGAVPADLLRRDARARRARVDRRLRDGAGGRAVRAGGDRAPPVDARQPARVLHRRVRALRRRDRGRARVDPRLDLRERALRARARHLRGLRRVERRRDALPAAPAEGQRHAAAARELPHRRARHLREHRRQGVASHHCDLGRRLRSRSS